jgi:hypothetical protein
LIDGTSVDGPASLREALMRQSDAVVHTFAEKLLIYALGRGLEYYDMPVVRSIARQAMGNDNRFSSFVLGIVKSTPFQMRRTEDSEASGDEAAAAARPGAVDGPAVTPRQ